MRATAFCLGRHGRMRKVVGSGMATMSFSSILANPSMEEPSKPTPCDSASSRSWAVMVNPLSAPRTSVNHKRMNLTSFSPHHAQHVTPGFVSIGSHLASLRPNSYVEVSNIGDCEVCVKLSALRFNCTFQQPPCKGIPLLSQTPVFSGCFGNANVGWSTTPLPFIWFDKLTTNEQGNSAHPRTHERAVRAPPLDLCSPFSRGQASQGWSGLEPHSPTGHSCESRNSGGTEQAILSRIFSWPLRVVKSG